FYALRARCRRALGEEAAFQADRQLADKTPPRLALDHSLRGEAALDAKQVAAAIQAFEKAVCLEPTDYWSMMKLGYCYCEFAQRREDLVTAVAVFSGCILKRPDHAHAYRCRGHAYSQLGRDEEAVADYSRTIELDPNHELAWSNRGEHYRKMGQ